MADRRPGSGPGFKAWLALVLAFLYLPIAVLVALSFNEGGLPTVWSGFSTKWYVSLASNHEILSAALNTLIVAVVSTAIATLLGTLLALGVETRRRKSRGLEALLFAPMIIPDIVLAIALLSFFSLLNVTHGPPHHHPRPCRLQPRLRLPGGAGAAEDRSTGRSSRLPPISAPPLSPPSAG